MVMSDFCQSPTLLGSAAATTHCSEHKLLFTSTDSYFSFRYEISDDVKRISTLSLFRKDVQPKFEDPKNKAGGDYKLRLAGGQGFATSEQSTLDFLNTIWEQLVQDLITHRFPHH
jgi:Eukaryotic initiation factor 4E